MYFGYLCSLLVSLLFAASTVVYGTDILPGQVEVISRDPMAQKISFDVRSRSKAVVKLLQTRTLPASRLTTIAIVVGVIGGVAMVAAISLVILLLARKRRDRRQGGDLVDSALTSPAQDMLHFPRDNSLKHTRPLMPPAPDPVEHKRHPYVYQHLSTPPSPMPLRATTEASESAWFMGNGDDEIDSPRKISSDYALDGKTARKKTSRQKLDPGLNPSPNPTPRDNGVPVPSVTTVSSQTRSTESGRSPKASSPSTMRALPPPPPMPLRDSGTLPLMFQKSYEPPRVPPTPPSSTSDPGRPIRAPLRFHSPPESRDLSPTSSSAGSPTPLMFRKGSDPLIAPRPRGSSLSRGYHPDPVPEPLPDLPTPLPERRHHIISASEDLPARPASRFSISPIMSTFKLPSRLTPTTDRRSRHTRGFGFGSVPTMSHFQNPPNQDASPNKTTR